MCRCVCNREKILDLKNFVWKCDFHTACLPNMFSIWNQMWQFHLCWHCHCPDISDYILSLCTFSFVCCICCLPSAFVFCFHQNEKNHPFTNVRRSKLVLTRCISYLLPCTDALSEQLGSLSFATALYKVVLHLLSRCSNDCISLPAQMLSLGFLSIVTASQ